MSLPTWPVGVPDAPQRDSWGISRPFNTPDITEFEAGNTRDRPRGTVQYQMIDQTIRMDTAAFEIFSAFVLTDLKRGTRRFIMNVWDGQGLVSRTVKLSGQEKYKVATRGRSLLVSMQLEVEL